jgi:hypothetical protein
MNTSHCLSPTCSSEHSKTHKTHQTHNTNKNSSFFLTLSSPWSHITASSPKMCIAIASSSNMCMHHPRLVHLLFGTANQDKISILSKPLHTSSASASHCKSMAITIGFSPNLWLHHNTTTVFHWQCIQPLLAPHLLSTDLHWHCIHLKSSEHYIPSETMHHPNTTTR